MGLKWVSCWCNKQLGDPKGGDFSTPWTEFDIFKGACWTRRDPSPPIPEQRIQCGISELSFHPSEGLAEFGLARAPLAQRGEDCQLRLALSPTPGTLAVPLSPQESCLCPPSGGTGASPAHRAGLGEKQFRSYPIRASLCCCQEQRLLFQVRERLPQIPAPGSSWLLQQPPPELGNEPGTSLALGQLCRAQERPQRWLCSSCLLAASPPSPAVTPSRWSRFSTKSLQQRFPDAASPQPGWAQTPPAFPQEYSRSGMFCSSRCVHESLLQQTPKAPRTSSLSESQNLLCTGRLRWIYYRCQVLEVCKERSYFLAEQLGKAQRDAGFRFEMEQEVSKPGPGQIWSWPRLCSHISCFLSLVPTGELFVSQ